ncbi:MAG: hypothetical protein AAF826_12455 [Pseudomonadota bacterium]
MNILASIRPHLLNRQRDYLLMTVFVFAQHGDYVRAKQIIDGMFALGERSEKILISQAVLEFFCGNYADALRCLDDLDRIADDGRQASQDTMRMRHYLRARCLYSSGRQAEAQDIATQLAAKPQKPRPS